MRTTMRLVVAGVGLAPALLLAGCRPTPWTAELVSESAGGTGAADGPSRDPVVSPDGTKVAFASSASDLGPTDTNGQDDVYVRDLETGEVTLVSVNADGTDAGNHLSFGPVFSPDGTKVGFTSAAGDLGAADANGSYDFYIRDLVAGTTTLVSATSDGSAPASGSSFAGTFGRADGTLVAFSSTANELVPDDPERSPGDQSDVFVRDLRTGTTTLVSVNMAGTGSGNFDSGGGVLSPDGTKVAFDSYASDLAPGDTNGDWVEDVYVRDLAAGTTELVSVNAPGTASGNGQSADPRFAPDSRRVGFSSVATDLVPGTDTNDAFDAFVRDLASDTTTLVSVDAAGSGTGDGDAHIDGFLPGGKVLFSGNTAGLGPTDTNGRSDVYVRDMAAGVTTLVSVNGAGTDAGNGPSVRPAASAAGTVAFETTATDLGPTDTNTCLRGSPPPLPPTRGPCWDVYVRDLAAGTTTLVSARADGKDSAAGDSQGPVMTADGTRVFFTSSAGDLGPPDTNQRQDVYVASK